jgi:hypothetical protein
LATTGAPVDPMGYPQLLPALLSIPYVLMDDVWIQFFSYAICLIFPSCVFLILLSIFDKFPISSFVTAIIIFLWPTQKFVHYAGYADFPVLIIGFLAFSAIIWGYKEDEKTRIKCLLLSAFFIGAACAIKQAGLLLLIFFPFIILEFKTLSSINKNLKIKLIILSSLISLFFALPWHIYNQYLLKIGLATSNFQVLTEYLHDNKPYIERIILAINKWPGIFILTLLGIPGLFIRENKSISFFGILFILIWMLFYSYDARNCYLAIPFLSFSIGLSCQRLIILRFNFFKSLNCNFLFFISRYKVKIISFSLLFVIIFISIFIFKSDDIKTSLYKRQDRKVLKINDKENDNKFIVNLYKNNPNSLFITNDFSISFINKDLKNKIYVVNIYSDDNKSYIDLINLIKDNKDKIIYLYYTRQPSDTFLNLFHNNLSLLFNGKGSLYKINDNNIILY